MPPIAFIILTKNEEANLPRCLDSIAGLKADVFVIDSGSTDRTVEIALLRGATVLHHAWVNYASQMNWAIDNIQTAAPWVMRLDADEQLSPELRAAIRDHLPRVDPHVSGAMVRLRVHFLGRWLRHGGLYPIWLTRLWRRGAARCEDRWMDEHMVLLSGDLTRIPADIIHENSRGLDEWTAKHVGYAERECRDALGKTSAGPPLRGPEGKKRWIKDRLYARLPLFIRAWVFWLYRYFLRLGFLDGAEGFAYHFLQCLWYRSLVDIKIFEFRRSAAARVPAALERRLPLAEAAADVSASRAK